MNFELGDWTFDRLTPDALLDSPLIRENEAQLQIPFRAGIAPPTEVELKLEAHRVLPASTERLSLSIPRPLVDVVAPATIVISPADNVELTPQISELIGLSTDAAAVRVPGRQQPPVVYRDLGGGEPTLFVATMRTLKRTTTSSREPASTLIGIKCKWSKRWIIESFMSRSACSSSKSRLRFSRAVACKFGWMMSRWRSIQSCRAGPRNPSLTRLQFSMPTDQIRRLSGRGAVFGPATLGWP